MTPCGTCCDERSSLSFQRAIHGSGVDDWTWGRWYWCRPGAEDLGRWTAYGHPGWETEVGTHFSGPEYQIQVGRRPVGRLGGAEPAVNLRVERYANSRTTPFPGLESHGDDAWYADGLPRSAYHQGEEVIRCGARIWQTEGGIGTPDVDDSPDYLLSMSGGGEGGGHLDVGTDCYIFYGGCVHMTGGGEGGGTMPMYASESFELSGGGEGGGEVPTEGTEGMGLHGGGEGGGGMDLDAADSLDLSGGGEGGGGMGSGGSPPVIHGYVFVERDSSSPVVFDLPPVVPGDTVLLFVVGSGSSAPATPDGYTIEATGDDPSFDPEYWLYQSVWDSGDPTELTLTWTGGGAIQLTAVTISNAGPITPATFLISDTTVVVPPAFSGIPPDSLVLLFLWTVANVGLDVPPSWPTVGDTSVDPTLGVLYWEEDFDDGDTEDATLQLTDGVEWVTGFVVAEPLPDEGELP